MVSFGTIFGFVSWECNFSGFSLYFFDDRGVLYKTENYLAHLFINFGIQLDGIFFENMVGFLRKSRDFFQNF